MDNTLSRWPRIVRFDSLQGAVALGCSLAHARAQSQHVPPWAGHERFPVLNGGFGIMSWPPARWLFTNGYPMPRALSNRWYRTSLLRFAAAARRALEAGFLVIEIHAAHGYLIKSSGASSTQRTDPTLLI